MSKHYPIYRSIGIWYVILYSKTILVHASIISRTTCMSIQSGGFLPLGMEGQMISLTAIIPQGSSAMPHFSPSSTTPADKSAVLLRWQGKIKIQKEGERNMLIKMHYWIFFAQLESWIKKKFFNFLVACSPCIPTEQGRFC